MGSSRLFAGSLAILVAACSEPVSKAESIDFKTLTGGVKGAYAVPPTCPVTVEFDAIVTVTKMTGVMKYRWERSTGVNGPEQTVKAPAAAATGPADIHINPDGWPITERGKQMTVTSRVHVLSPLDVKSDVLSLNVKCN